MQNHGAHRAPQIAPAAITGTSLLKTYGDRWDIRRELAAGIFTAERRSPDGAHIRFICARSAPELAGKLDAAELAAP